MDWQQPNQTNSTIPEFSYFPFYQQDANQANYNYEDDNEGWDDDEEYDGYQAYSYGGNQQSEMMPQAGGLDEVVSSQSARFCHFHQSAHGILLYIY
jgi:hypothetical protein